MGIKLANKNIKMILVSLLTINLIIITYTILRTIFFKYSGIIPYQWDLLRVVPFILTIVYIGLTIHVIKTHKIDDAEMFKNEITFIRIVKWLPRTFLFFAIIGTIFFEINYGGTIPREVGNNLYKLYSVVP